MSRQNPTLEEIGRCSDENGHDCIQVRYWVFWRRWWCVRCDRLFLADVTGWGWTRSRLF